MGARYEHDLVRLGGNDVLLEEELDPVGDALGPAVPAPTRIGPKRTWMWALILRSHQIMNMDATEM